MFPFISRGWLIGAVALTLSCQVWVAHAIPFNPAITINGTVSLDTVNSTTPSGSANQNGTLAVTAGGATNASTFTGLTVTGSNPLAQGLTDINDRLGIGFHVDGTFNNGAAQNNFLFGDYTISLSNSSATDTFEISLGVSVVRGLAASGVDAFVIGELRIEDVLNNLLVFANHTRDTANGDSDTPVSPGSFSVTLAPGQSLTFDGLLSLRGGAFLAGSSYSGDINAEISVAGVRQVNVSQVPEPGTIALLALGLGVLGMRRYQALRRA